MIHPRAQKVRMENSPPSRWKILQRGLGYLLLIACFLSVLIYVYQSIEIKNIAYTMQDLMEYKQKLLEEKHQIEIALLERQSFSQIETRIKELNLPLEPGPRLKIVLAEDLENRAVEPVSLDADENSVWRHWLERMNQAHAMMTGHTSTSDEWRTPVWTGQPMNPDPESEEQKSTG